ncbi:MAG: gluconeogenesis factor YvcK family protein [Patescibacteria group bacterium]|nr:gluconeogenesis factor YvcK family protein [Patescibacteria group bacterium]
MKKVVCFSGGNAVPRAVLMSLKTYPVNITTVVSMVDNGGSSGQLRADFNVLPPGDIRRHILALSKAPQWKKDLWQFRFGNEKFDGGHIGHNFANAFIAGLEYNLKDYDLVLKAVNEFMEVQGRALPATIEQAQICAKLENSEIIKGEDEIDVPQIHDPNLKIKKVYLDPVVKAYQPTLDAILEADLIVIGPGDLYSSSIPCLLMSGMKKAFKKTKAKKVFVCNIMTKYGETNNFSVLDFSNEVEKYMGCDFDYVIYNTEIPSKKRLKKFKKEELGILDLVEIDKGLDEKKFIGIDIIEKNGPLIHNPDKLVKLIMSL